MTERLPWFARAWTRPFTTRRMAWGAAAYLLTGVLFLLLAFLRDGLFAWLTIAGAAGMLWLGGTLAATGFWRRTNTTSTQIAPNPHT